MEGLRLTPTEQEWVAKARKLAQEEFVPRAREIDEQGRFPAENMQRLREEGILLLAVPQEYGGYGTDAYWCAALPHLVLEEVAAGCANTGWCLVTHFHYCGIAGMGNEEQKRRWFGEVVENGALIGSLGSEVQPQQAKAAADTATRITYNASFEPVEGGFRATATKGFCSLASVAEWSFYWALAPGTETNAEGLVIAGIPHDTPGYSFLPGWEDSTGLRGTESGGAKLENVFIPWENVVGEPGDWVQKHPYTFELTYAVQLTGTAQGVYNFVLQLLRDRPYLQTDDTVMFTVGEMSSDLQAARTSWRYAQSLWDDGLWDEAAHASMRALHQAKRTAVDVANKAYEVCGTRALFKFNPVDRGWRNGRTVTLHTRESQLMRYLAEGDITGEKFAKEKYGPRIAPNDRKTWADLGIDREEAHASA
jgi:alkylation response protein AidB-like acyl-CoA dehydrogenase